MVRMIAAALALALSGPAARAQSGERAQIDATVAALSQAHGVPESLVHRIIQRESRYSPRLVSRGHYGLMQISFPTARSMGYAGAPDGLLDARTNLTYGVPYLANAWRLAGSSDGAVRLYSSGYYLIAKRKHMLASLRTAASPSLAPPPPPPAPTAAPVEEPVREEGVSGFFGKLLGAEPQPEAAPPPPPEDPEAQGAEMQAPEPEPQLPQRPVPLPPVRPAGLR